MKIWNTKYCLTDGITEHDAEVTGDCTMAVLPKTKANYRTVLHGEGKDWHRSREAAILRANEVKIKKLKSLDRQVKKISAIEFDS